MTRWLLDTTILSELRRPKPDPKVLAFIAAQPLEQFYVSAVAFAEIRFGIELVADPCRPAGLNDWLAHRVRPMFEERVLPVTEYSCSIDAFLLILTVEEFRVCPETSIGITKFSQLEAG